MVDLTIKHKLYELSAWSNEDSGIENSDLVLDVDVSCGHQIYKGLVACKQQPEILACYCLDSIPVDLGLL